MNNVVEATATRSIDPKKSFASDSTSVFIVIVVVFEVVLLCLHWLPKVLLTALHICSGLMSMNGYFIGYVLSISSNGKPMKVASLSLNNT